MSSFSIDDVRDTLTADVNHFLGRIEEAARGLLDAHAKLAGAAFQDPAGRPLFELVGDHSHAIAGTCGLVSADSLADTARLLERLSEAGQESVRQVEFHANRAKKLADLFVEGVG